MIAIHIKNGRVFDPETQLDAIKDILIVDKFIFKIADSISDEEVNQILKQGGATRAEDLTVIHADDCYVMPGLIDLHVHFREPGYEHKETIRTGARAAARGGYTTVCPMPNTDPVIDCIETLEHEKDLIKESTYINVLPIASMTAGEDGEFLTDYEALKAHGACAVSEDGKSVMNARIARQAMRLAALTDVPVFDHCEDIDLRARGVMNAGNRAKELGVYGILNAVEDIITARDILLAESTGARLHLCHISTEGVVKMLRHAKREGLAVTAEVTPHHLTLCDEDVDINNSNYKMNPPLRSRKDVEVLREALADGTIDCIATDHAPHSRAEKKADFNTAPFGITGLETAVSIIMTELVNTGIITPMQMAEKMSYNPAKILRIERGRLQEGYVADVTIIDPNQKYVIDSSKFMSKGKNTPYEGKEVTGDVIATIVSGRLVYMNVNQNEIVIDKDTVHDN